MTNALELVHSLDIDMICPGHGPVLDSHIPELLAIYAEWCKIPTNEKTTVVIPYVSAYGYTEQLAEKITEGILEAGDIAVKRYDLVTADAAEVAPGACDFAVERYRAVEIIEFLCLRPFCNFRIAAGIKHRFDPCLRQLWLERRRCAAYHCTSEADSSACGRWVPRALQAL